MTLFGRGSTNDGANSSSTNPGGTIADRQQMNHHLLWVALLGLAVVVLHAGIHSIGATALLWSLACFIAGAAIGFLFGIPKIIQTNAKPVTANDGKADTHETIYRQQVNTNLTEISDWLTKIIVGLGLINLKGIPTALSHVSLVLAKGLSPKEPASESAFAMALLVCFPVIGFLYGYLVTRLVLARAFSQADQEAAQEKVTTIIQEEMARTASAVEHDSTTGKDPNIQQLESAAKVSKLAQQSNPSLLKQQMLDLAREYERTRAGLPQGDERTRRLDVIAAKMRILALTVYDFLPEFAHSEAVGERLAAITMLQVKPSAEWLDWLAERLATEVPFIGYQAAVALLYAARTLDAKMEPKIRAAILKGKEALRDVKPDSDRMRFLVEAEREINARGGHH